MDAFQFLLIMETILHLFITDTCRHDCPLCCNKLYVIDEIPTVTVSLLKRADTVCLTGGEPLSLDPIDFYNFCLELRSQYPNIKNLYVYTSGKELKNHWDTLKYLTTYKTLSGINVAPKDTEDWDGFVHTYKEFPEFWDNLESNRLYVFDDQREAYAKVKPKLAGINAEILGRKWQQVFNTPDNEYFVRLPILY